MADPYKEYSQPWFGTHKVLRGGCWLTRSRLLRNTLRNFYLPGRRDIWAGFASVYEDPDSLYVGFTVGYKPASGPEKGPLKEWQPFLAKDDSPRPFWTTHAKLVKEYAKRLPASHEKTP